MSKPDHGDNAYGVSAPLTSGCTGARLTLSTASVVTAAALPLGRYAVALYLTGGVAWATFAAAAALPTSTAAPTAGYFALRDGEMLVSDGTLQLAVILTAGSGELGLTKVA